jgi:hypothetical protein
LGETLTAKDLTKFAYGVAKGMEFLVSKGVSLPRDPTGCDVMRNSLNMLLTKRAWCPEEWHSERLNERPLSTVILQHKIIKRKNGKQR